MGKVDEWLEPGLIEPDFVAKFVVGTSSRAYFWGSVPRRSPPGTAT